MQLARNACALADTRVQRDLELMMQLPDTPLVGRPQQRQKEHRAEGAKPVCLVVRGCDGEIQLCRGIVPHAVTVGRDYAERILPGRQICVKRLPARTGVVPVMVIAVEPVAKFYLLWNQEGGRSVINLQVARERGHFEVLSCCEFLTVSD